VSELEEDGEEPEHPNEDRAHRMRTDIVDGDEDATAEDQGVLRYCPRRRCSCNPRVSGGARVLKTLVSNPRVS
jgi:hypothetical protein